MPALGPGSMLISSAACWRSSSGDSSSTKQLVNGVNTAKDVVEPDANTIQYPGAHQPTNVCRISYNLLKHIKTVKAV